MDMLKVLCTKWIPDECVQEYEDVFEFIRPDRMKGSFSQTELKGMIAEAEVLFSIAGTPVTRPIMDAGKCLKMIASLGVGFDHVDMGHADCLGLPVINSPTQVSDPTAEHTVALIMGIFHNLYRYTAQIKRGVWSTEPFGTTQTSVAGHVLGIIGMGRIGQCVGRKAAALGMDVSYYDPVRLSTEIEEKEGFRYGTLEEVIKESDCISLHVPYTGENRHMFGASAFALMKTGSYFVNASRGALVDLKALADALKTGRLKGAALDVFETEPYAGGELEGMEQVILTPHVASETWDARIHMAGECLDGVKKLSEGIIPDNVVNKKILKYWKGVM